MRRGGNDYPSLASFKDFDPSYETGTKGDSMNKKMIRNSQ